MYFRKKLSSLRKKRGMTQVELAEKLDVTHQAVSTWERGTAKPSTEKLIAIARLLEVSVEELTETGDVSSLQTPPDTQTAPEASAVEPEQLKPEPLCPTPASRWYHSKRLFAGGLVAVVLIAGILIYRAAIHPKPEIISEEDLQGEVIDTSSMEYFSFHDFEEGGENP